MAFSLKDLGLVDRVYPLQPSGYIMALDSGTTSVRAIIVDEYGCIVAQASKPVKAFYPQPGWVEQDPMEILASQIAVMMEVQFKSGIHSDSIAAIGITNQRETWRRVGPRARAEPIDTRHRMAMPPHGRYRGRPRVRRVRRVDWSKTGLAPMRISRDEDQVDS